MLQSELRSTENVDLTKLHLLNTEVTDAGLEHLKGLSKLRDLSVGDTKVTPGGGKKLQEALPQCRVEY